MSSDHEAEIRASVAAHADLGPGYDDAVAEGLVERIGAEIDKRIDARLGQLGAAVVPGTAAYQGPGAPAGAHPGAPMPAGAAGVPGAAVPQGAAGAAGPIGAPEPAAGVPGVPGVPGSVPGYQGYQTPIGYQGYQGYMGPMLPPGYQMGPPPVRPSPAGQRNVATTVTALGSMALGVAATAIVSHSSNPGGQAFMVLLIWVAIVVVNVVYARRH
jgi:hypothetical protein